jgi:hypothetical protein
MLEAACLEPSTIFFNNIKSGIKYNIKGEYDPNTINSSLTQKHRCFGTICLGCFLR